MNDPVNNPTDKPTNNPPSKQVVSFQKWMLEHEEFLDRLGKHCAKRIADSILERGEVDWEEVINGLSQDMEREMNWFAPRAQA